MGSHETEGKPFVKTENSQLVSFSALHISHKAAKAVANLTSQLCGDLELAVCSSRGDAWSYIKITQALVDVH